MDRNLFVALLGPSGVGKSSIIRKIIYSHPERYEYVRPYTTRPLRHHETDKFHVSLIEFETMMRNGEIVLPNNIYDNWYGPKRDHILNIIKEGRIPLLDWPVQRAKALKEEFSSLDIFCVYVRPLNRKTLEHRLKGRDSEGVRLEAALQELEKVELGAYPVIDAMVISTEGIEMVAAGVDVIIQYHKSNKHNKGDPQYAHR